jgi:hypothetical protein
MAGVEGSLPQAEKRAGPHKTALAVATLAVAALAVAALAVAALAVAALAVAALAVAALPLAPSRRRGGSCPPDCSYRRLPGYPW